MDRRRKAAPGSSLLLEAALLVLAILPFSTLDRVPCPPCGGGGYVQHFVTDLDAIIGECRLCECSGGIPLWTRLSSDLSTGANLRQSTGWCTYVQRPWR
jgi:hypothetical protein